MISNTKFAYGPVQVISGGNKQDIVKGLGWYFGQNFFYYHRFRILKWQVFYYVNILHALNLPYVLI